VVLGCRKQNRTSTLNNSYFQSLSMTGCKTVPSLETQTENHFSGNLLTHILIFTCSYSNHSVNWNPIILIVFLPQIIRLLRRFCGYGASCTELPHPFPFITSRPSNQFSQLRNPDVQEAIRRNSTKCRSTNSVKINWPILPKI